MRSPCLARRYFSRVEGNSLMRRSSPAMVTSWIVPALVASAAAGDPGVQAQPGDPGWGPSVCKSWESIYPCWLGSAEDGEAEYGARAREMGMRVRFCEVASVLGIEWDREFWSRSYYDRGGVDTGRASFVCQFISWGGPCTNPEWAVRLSHQQRSDLEKIERSPSRPFVLETRVAESNIACSLVDGNSDRRSIAHSVLSIPEELAVKVQLAWFRYLYSARLVWRPVDQMLVLEGGIGEGQLEETMPATYWVTGRRWNTTHHCARFSQAPEASLNRVFLDMVTSLREAAEEGSLSGLTERIDNAASLVVELSKQHRPR